MNTTIPTKVVTAAAMLWSLSGQAQLIDEHGVDLLEAETAYTLTNLHPDEQRARLYAVNFQQPGLIPRCTEVRFTRLRRSAMRFEVPSRGDKEYEYLNHSAAAEPFPDHLRRFFGSECDPGAIESLSEIDREGIADGRPRVGMTRQGIIYALGYPPRHVNPSLDSGDWTYWSSRFDRFIVYFDSEGIVTGIRD